MDLTPVPIARPRELRGHGETVLLIEDDVVLRPLFEKTLHQFNYRVLVAASVPEALLAWSAHRTVIRAVVTDQRLGPGRDGLSLLEEFSADQPSVVMVLASGALMPEVVELLHRTTRIQCLAKPFSLVDLLRVLHRSLKATT